MQFMQERVSLFRKLHGVGVDGSFLKWLFNFLTGAVGYKQAASVEKGSAAFLVP
jgi:hypothetical protein